MVGSRENQMMVTTGGSMDKSKLRGARILVVITNALSQIVPQRRRLKEIWKDI
jgi:hypothetical protein